MSEKLKQWCPEYVTTGFVAEHCGVSSVTVLRWIEKGRLSAFRLPDGHYRVYRDDFAGFLARYQIPAHHEARSENEDT
ncbi:MAG: excisionase family DNA-binding protein [Chloroflexota bacterium]|nr:excisionase family DNA-binding protein [Chloroflexota bacterium]